MPFARSADPMQMIFVAILFFAVIVSPTAAQAANLRLSWVDNSNNEDGFKIERLSGGTFVQIGTAGMNATSYKDSSLTTGSIYCYRVRAFNSAGVSAPSNQACASTSDFRAFSVENTLTQSETATGSTSTPVSTGASSNNLLSPLGGPWANYRLSLKMRSDDNDSIGVMFRYVDNNNYYRFSWNRQNNYRRLDKLENGVVEVLAEDAVRYVSGRTYHLEITAQGTNLEVRIAGAQVFSVTDSTFDKGTIALYSWYNQGAFFDDVLVEDLVTGAVLLWEDFEDHDLTGWTIVDDADTADGRSAWSAEPGALVQSSNIGSNGKGKLGTFALYTARDWTDYRVTMKIGSMDDDSIGVMFRYQDKNNYYRFSWNSYSNQRLLEKRQNGVFQLLAQDAVPYVTNRTYLLEIIVQGAGLQIRIDGVLIFSISDSSLDSGSIALYSWFNRGSLFDDILVQDLHTGEVLLSDDFNDANLTGWTIVDEGLSYGPSIWTVKNGMASQNSNIGSYGATRPGTFALY